jgi:hypothetical protein
MAEEQESPAFMSALVTEHFALQSVASATISESGSRAAIYLSALSSGLVAVGFASSSRGALVALVLSVFPTVFILGIFTSVRLIDTSVQNIVALRRIEVIRRYYASLRPNAPAYFAPDRTEEGIHGVRYRSRSMLFTIASMIIVVNSVLGGATVALFFALVVTLAIPVAVSIGVLVGAVLLLASLWNEYRRLSPLILSSSSLLPEGQVPAT